MNERAIRSLIRGALGEAQEPPGMAAGVEARLRRATPAPRTAQRVLAAAVGLVLVAGIGVVWYGSTAKPRVISHPSVSPSSAPDPSPSPAANNQGGPPVPAADIEAAHLAATAVATPIGLSVTSSGATVTLLGAYADSVQTVLFFHEEPAVGDVGVQLFDDKGQLLAGSTSGGGLPGDYWFAVQAGLRAAPGTSSHGSAQVVALTPPKPGSPLRGTWGFDFRVPLQLSDELSTYPGDFQLATWRVRIQSMTATPASFQLQALVTGAPAGAFGHDGVSLVDPTGVVLQPVFVNSGVTAPKQAVNPTNSQDTFLTVFWKRTPPGGEYILRLTGNGTSHDIPVLVPASAPGDAVGKVRPSASGSFPADLSFSGPLSGHIGAVAVSLCASHALGSSGGYATVLRAPVGGGVVTISVMVNAPRYLGPGTYPAYRDTYNGGREGVEVSVEGGDYFSQPPPGGNVGTFTILTGGTSGTFDGVQLKGNGGGEIALSGSWTCR